MVVVSTDDDGMLPLQEVQINISDGSDEHSAPTSLLCIENTHNRCGGTVLSVEQVEQLSSLAHTHSLTVHMDGARVFNAAIALAVPASTLVRTVDSVMFCLSKGLSAPVGSMLVGSREFIHRAHRVRKLLGGGMRQAGILAAAGIVALEQMVDRLAEDHETSKQLAYGLADYPQIDINVDHVVTNMVMFSLRNDQQESLSEEKTMQFLEKAKAHGVLMGHIGQGKIRAVTHYGIDTNDITTALTGIRRALIDSKM